MQRLFRMTAALIASLMVLFAAGPVLASAQAGVTSATTYESTLFGYEVEWTEDWEVVENFTRSIEGMDQLRILNSTIGIWVDIWGMDTNRTAESMMGPYTDLLVNSELSIDVESEELETSLPGAAVVVYNYLFGSNQTPLEELTEFRTIDGAFIITSVKAAPERSVLAATLVSTQITIDGDPIFPALFEGDADTGDDTDVDEDEDVDDTDVDEDEDENDTPVAGDGLNGNVYVSPNFGVALSFDESQWEVIEEVEAEDEDGRDVLSLSLIDPFARLWLESYGTITSASDCIESASAEATPADLDVEILEDEDGEEIEGSSRGVAWTAYTWEDEDGEGWAAYVECRAIPGQTGVFVVTMITALDDYEDAYEALAELLTSVNLEDGEPEVIFDAVDTSDEDEDVSEDDQDADEDENQSDASGTVYESPTWGFTLTIDEGTWEIGRERSRNDVDTLTLEGDDDMFLEMSAFELGRRDDAQSCAEDAVDNFDFEIDVAEEDDADGTYSVLGSYVDDDDEEWAIVITCFEDPSGDFVVQFVGEAPIDLEDDLLDAMEPLVNSIEFP
jgi:hypothetical protein